MPPRTSLPPAHPLNVNRVTLVSALTFLSVSVTSLDPPVTALCSLPTWTLTPLPGGFPREHLDDLDDDLHESGATFAANVDNQIPTEIIYNKRIKTP